MIKIYKKSLKDNRCAFTLAEVLITLAIIGIVAAMTIPALITKYQEKVTVTKVKKMYSTLSNAYGLYIAANGTPQMFPQTEQGAKDAFEVFRPYLKIATDCGTLNGEKCIYTGKYSLKSGTSAGVMYSNNNQYYKAVLNDGSTIWLRGYTNPVKMTIFYDVNGKSGPNKWGTDLFQFHVIGERIKPGASTDNVIEEHCLSANGSGYGCASWVIEQGNLEYLRCDDLSYVNGKLKCD